MSADGKRLLGAVLVGDCADYDTLLQYFLNGIELPAAPETLILPAVAGGAPKLGPAALPLDRDGLLLPQRQQGRRRSRPSTPAAVRSAT